MAVDTVIVRDTVIQRVEVAAPGPQGATPKLTSILVAAADAPDDVFISTIYQCAGVNDHRVFNSAMVVAEASGKPLEVTSGTLVGALETNTTSSISQAAAFVFRDGVPVKGAGRKRTILTIAPITRPQDVPTYTVSNVTNRCRLTVARNYWHDTQIGQDTDIVITDLTVDGAGASQISAAYMHGLTLWGVRDATIERVCVANVVGGESEALPTSEETFGISLVNCSDIVVSKSKVERTTVCLTSSGMSADYCTNVSWDHCRVRGMVADEAGFTHYGCKNLTYTACYAYKNAGKGFNSEASEDVVYVACISGGIAATVASGSNPYMANGENLGNGGHGYVAAVGTKRVSYSLCLALNNGLNGFHWSGSATDVEASNCRAVGNAGIGFSSRIVRASWHGGEISGNLYGVDVNSGLITDSGPAFELALTGDIKFRGPGITPNTNGDVFCPGGIIHSCRGGASANPPAVASGVAQPNPLARAALVYLTVTGGTWIDILVFGPDSVGNASTRTTSGNTAIIPVPARCYIQPYYTGGTLTWNWLMP